MENNSLVSFIHSISYFCAGHVGNLSKDDSFGELPHIKSQHHSYEAIADEYTGIYSNIAYGYVIGLWLTFMHFSFFYFLELVVINKKESLSLFSDARESQLQDVSILVWNILLTST
jgi:hypothetical protein